MSIRPRIDASRPAPPAKVLATRAAEIAATARQVLRDEGPDALTMRRIGEELSIRAPSLYKHFANKAAIELVLVEAALREMGTALRAAVHGLAPEEAVGPLLDTYRHVALDDPELYRLATVGRLHRDELTEGLEDWSGEPFLSVFAEPYLAQAAWSAAHGMVVLELDGRYPPDTDADLTWAAATAAFRAAISPV